MSIVFSVLIIVGLSAFAIFQIVNIVRDINFRKQNKANKEDKGVNE